MGRCARKSRDGSAGRWVGTTHWAGAESRLIGLETINVSVRRARRLLEKLGDKPTVSIPAACGGWDETRAAYRLFDHLAATAEGVLAPHIACTEARLREHPRVLCIQDTSELDYTTKQGIAGLGPLNYKCRRVYFKVLKSGCRVEQLQLEKRERLEPALAFYMIIAWRVLYLTMLGRACPQMCCDSVFADEQWQAVYLVTQRKSAPEQPPSLDTRVRMVATLSGFLNRKGDGFPGAKTLWIGLQRIPDSCSSLSMHSAASRRVMGNGMILGACRDRPCSICFLRGNSQPALPGAARRQGSVVPVHVRSRFQHIQSP